MAQNLARDLKVYHNGDAPFNGGKSDGKDWWKSLVVNVNSHPLKALAIKLFSIVPHAAEIERFFSNLGGIQSIKRSNLTIPHMQTFGTLRNHYVRQLHEIAIAAGKPTRRKHAHMHTPIQGGGINVGRADELLKDVLWTPPLIPERNGPSTEAATAAEPSPEEIDAEFDKLSMQEVSRVDGDRLAASVPISEVYNLSTLDDIRAGKPSANDDFDELELVSKDPTANSWDPASLLRSLGV